MMKIKATCGLTKKSTYFSKTKQKQTTPTVWHLTTILKHCDKFICSSRYAPSSHNPTFSDRVNLWNLGRSGTEDILFEEQIKKVQTVKQCSEELVKAFACRSSKEKI